MLLGDAERGRPNDARGFLHKSKFGRFVTGAVSTLIPAVGIARKVISTVAPLVRTRQPVPTTVVPTTFAPTTTLSGVTPGNLAVLTPQSIIPRTTGVPRMLQLGGGDNGAAPCPPPLLRSPQGNCIAPTSPRGASLFQFDAFAGQYGAGFIPGSEIRDIAICPTGTALGKDGICYAKLANRNRKYPRGRRPLLTGGDMNAITRARRAGVKLANAKTDLVAIGMLKVAKPRKRKTPVVC